MALRLDDYQNHHELLDKIRYINKFYYEPAAENILYLEENDGALSIAFAIALRDAYSHLARIFEYEDILKPDNKIKIARQLERYLGHLEELLYDTYLKIIKKKSDELFTRLRKGDQPKIKMQLALRLQKVRTVDDNITIEQRIHDFKEIISFIEKIYSTYQF